MKQPFRLDKIDTQIINLLTTNATLPFLQIARKCKISGAAVHQHFKKIKQQKILGEATFKIIPKSLGFNTCAFIGLQLQTNDAGKHDNILSQLKKVPEIVECHSITGRYSIFIKVYTPSNEALRTLIVEKIQTIPEIISTETFLSLGESFMRQVPVEIMGIET